jgi:hypothetical protein
LGFLEAKIQNCDEYAVKALGAVFEPLLFFLELSFGLNHLVVRDFGFLSGQGEKCCSRVDGPLGSLSPLEMAA